MLLKSSSRTRFTEASGLKIRSFLADADLYLSLCRRPRDRWAYFVLSWLGTEEAEKVRGAHIDAALNDCTSFREGLITLFGKFEFQGAFRAQLRVLKQSGAESVSAYAARTTDLCAKAYAEFSTEHQLNLAIDHFIGGLADVATRDHLQRERARRALEWQETVRIAQAKEATRIANAAPSAAAVVDTSTSWRDSESRAQHDHERAAKSRKPRSKGTKEKGKPTKPPYHAAAVPNERDSTSETDSSTSASSDASFRKHASGKRSQSMVDRTKLVCFKCGKRGHSSGECKSDTQVPRCYECGGFGHLARDCATRKALLAEESQSASKAPPQRQLQSHLQSAPL